MFNFGYVETNKPVLYLFYKRFLYVTVSALTVTVAAVVTEAVALFIILTKVYLFSYLESPLNNIISIKTCSVTYSQNYRKFDSLGYHC